VVTETNTISITATFNEQRNHRYTLRRVWDESKPTATIIMSNASKASVLQGDLTSMLIQNNLVALGYGAVTCVNLFSFMCQKLDLSGNIEDLTNDENTQQILQAVKDSDVCIIGIGSLSKTYKKASVYQNRLFEHLHQYQDKICVIASPDGSEGHHPLSAKLREFGSWELVPYKLPDPPPTDKKDIDAPSGTVNPSMSGKSKRNSKKGNDRIIPLTS
jgi:hypothetical protein